MNIVDLPEDILINIFRKLNLCDLCNVIQTCKTFRDLVVNDNILWRKTCQDWLFMENPSQNSPQICTSWYKRCRISSNWRWGLYKDRVIVRFETKYMPWMKYLYPDIIIFSKGYNLQCCSLSKRTNNSHNNETFWTLGVPTVARNDVRTNDISRFILRNNILACGNRDGSIAVYKTRNIKHKPKLLCHIKDCHENGQVEVSAVEIVGVNNYNHVVTASQQSRNLLFWPINENDNNIQNNAMDISIRNGEGVKCLAVNNAMDKLAIGLDGNCCPLLFDANSCNYLITADGVGYWSQVIRDIGWHNENTLVYVTHKGMLYLLDVRTQEIVYKANDPFISTLYCVKSDCNNAIMVGSAEYTRCVLFDARNSSKHVQMYFTHKRLSSPVYSLDFNSNTLIAAADRRISALNFNVNISALHRRDYSHEFQHYSA